MAPAAMYGVAVALAAAARSSNSPLIARSLASRSSRVMRSTAGSAIEAAFRDAHHEQDRDDRCTRDDDEVRHERPAVVECVGLGLHGPQAGEAQQYQTDRHQQPTREPA